MKKMRKTNKKGFTLVELVIVIAVLAILAAIAIPTVAAIIDNANKSAAESNAHQVQAAINTYLAKIESGLVTDADPTITEALNDYGTSADALGTKGKYGLTYDNSTHTVSVAETNTALAGTTAIS